MSAARGGLSLSGSSHGGFVFLPVASAFAAAAALLSKEVRLEEAGAAENNTAQPAEANDEPAPTTGEVRS